MKYEIRLSSVPDGAYTEQYICGPSNGNGSADDARRQFRTRREAQQVVREFRAAKRAHPEDFEFDMQCTIEVL